MLSCFPSGGKVSLPLSLTDTGWPRPFFVAESLITQSERVPSSPECEDVYTQVYPWHLNSTLNLTPTTGAGALPMLLCVGAFSLSREFIGKREQVS